MTSPGMHADFLPAAATQTVPCPVCDHTEFARITEAGDYEYELPGVFYISECRRCGLILQNPRPPFEEILRYYTEKYEPYRQVGSSLVQKIRHRFLVQPRVELYRRLVGDHGHIVDVGCATGGLLLELSRCGGWKLTGVEPVVEAAAMGRAQGLDVIPRTLETSGLPDGSADLAIMNHVLEHLPDPMTTAEHVFRILKPGGHFVGEIPSPGCVERAIFGKYWGGYHLPRHLTFFAPADIKRFLERVGFENIEVGFQPQPSSSLLSLTNRLQHRNAPKRMVRFFGSHNIFWLAALTPLTAVLKLFGSAPIIHFKARKPRHTPHHRSAGR